jgi:carbon monoxide dehydrogenase subunit G
MSRRFVVAASRELDATPDELWNVIADTSRYADWVDGVLEVTSHHGPAVEGGQYSERNRMIGPVTARSTWTVVRQERPSLREDHGEGLWPLADIRNTFRLTSTGNGRTRMEYEVDFMLRLGPLAPLVATVLTPSLKADFTRSMQNLETLVLSG